MKITLLILQLLTIPLLAAETTIQLGDTAITVPAPIGFAPVTKDMVGLDQLLETFVAPDNVRFISLIPEELLPVVRGGEIPDMPRTISLQTNKKAVTRTMTSSDFVDLKTTLRKQNDEMMKQIKMKMPGLFEKAGKSIEEQYNTKFDMKMEGIVPLPPHGENERSMASSMMLNLAITTPDGQKTNYHGVVTTTFLHARGKLFFIYVNGGQDDLAWSRQMAKDWAEAILTANPPDKESLARESKRSGGFDWSQVGRTTVIGALIGGAVGLFSYLSKRRTAG